MSRTPNGSHERDFLPASFRSALRRTPAALLSLLLLAALPRPVIAEEEAGDAPGPVADGEEAPLPGLPDSQLVEEDQIVIGFGTGATRSLLSAEDREQLHRVLSSGRAYRVRVQAAIMLGRRGNVDDDLPALRRALRDDSHYTVRGAAAIAIGNLKSPRGIEPLLVAAGDHHNFVRRAANTAMNELAADEGAVPYLLLAREREAPHVRMAAVEALGRMDSREARLGLAEFLGDREEGVRAAAERVVSTWERADVVASLTAAISHPSSFHIRANAARLAAHYPDPRLIDALAGRLVAPLEEPSVQVASLESLEAMREHLDLEELVKRVQGVPNRDIRIRAIVLLGIKGGDRAVDVLMRSAADPDIRVRGYSVMALGQAGNANAARLLMRMREDPENARIRGIITASLQDLSSAP